MDDGEDRITMELYLMLPKYLINVERCVQCGEHYKECGNVGRHLCRVHPGVRMLTNDTVPTRAFYSCCHRPIQAKGCLQVDHSTCILTEENASMRLQQLRDFGTMIIPRLLLRFITRPLKTSVIYDTNDVGGTAYPSFDYRFPALEQVHRQNQTLTLTHARQVVDWCPRSVDDEDVTLKEIDLEKEAHTLYVNSKNSPLFSQLKGIDMSSQKALIKQCNKALRTRILGADAVANGDDGGADHVPFIIVSRIHYRLDSFLK